jgi:cytidylate kinase
MTFMAPASIVAIDGPVASGKSSVGRALAERLGYLFFDTGLMYRALTYLAARAGLDVHDAQALTAFAEATPIDVVPAAAESGNDCVVLAGDENIYDHLRDKAVESLVSPVAAVPAVRTILTERMRAVGLRGRVVMVGRDVGTAIVPEADCKIFLTASAEARASRRFEETQARGEGRTHADILANLRERDRIDSSRATAPLRAASDAIVVDTTGLDLPAVVEHLVKLVNHERVARPQTR